MFSTVLLVSPCRSSFVTVTAQSAVTATEAAYNGESSQVNVPPNEIESVALLRPWRVVAQRVFASRAEAEVCAATTSAASGVRSRLNTIDSAAATTGGQSWVEDDFRDPRRSLDGMTYVSAEFVNPDKPKRRVGPLRVLVDTGSSDCELSAESIEQLKLRPVDTALFETARRG